MADDVRTLVMKVLQKHPGKVISTAMIGDELIDQANRKQVTNALGALTRSKSRPEVVSMGRGTVMYLPKLNGVNANGNGKRKARSKAKAEAEVEVEETEAEYHVAGEPTVSEVVAVLADLPSRPKALSSEARKSPECTPTPETITPQTAAMYLSANAKNRDLRIPRVVGLVGSINRGEWQVTNNGIGFDTTGYLRDGQHRLAAVMVSGKSVQMFVVRGLKAKAQDVMDKNLTRSMADALKLRQPPEIYTTILGAALGWLYRLEYMNQTGQIHYRNQGEGPQTTQLLSLLDANPGIRDVVASFARAYPKTDVPLRSGVYCALWYRFRQLDAVEADMFTEQLFDGSNLQSDSPVLVLRRQLIADKARHFERMPHYREAALTIKAWNAWRENLPVTNLTFKYGPRHKDDFPYIQ